MGHTQIIFSADQAAAALWRYGEDELVDRASLLTEAELRQLWRLAGSHWKEDHGLPLRTRLVSDKAIAFACIEFLEGRLRPLRQERRRPQKQMPIRLQGAAPVPFDTDLTE